MLHPNSPRDQYNKEVGGAHNVFVAGVLPTCKHKFLLQQNSGGRHFFWREHEYRHSASCSILRVWEILRPGLGASMADVLSRLHDDMGSSDHVRQPQAARYWRISVASISLERKIGEV